MNKNNRKGLNISYVISVLFIMLILSVIMYLYHVDLEEDMIAIEEGLYKELNYQVNIVDSKMKEIIDMGKLQKLWIEEIPQLDVKNIDLENYEWKYYGDLDVTSLVESDELLGSIFIKGSISELDDNQINTLKRMLASFSVRTFLNDHIDFSSGAIYYSDYDIISAYPSEDVYNFFDPTGMPAEKIFKYIKDNIRMLRDQGSEEDYTEGWESNLNPDVNGNGILFTRNWTVFNGDEISGIYQSSFNLEPLNNILDKPYDEGHIFIVDPVNQLVYDDGKAATEVNEFSLFDMDDIDNYDENPYGQGLLANDGEFTTYILPLSSTKWKMIYQIDRDTLIDYIEKPYLEYSIYVFTTLALGYFLLSYVHRINVERRKEKEKIIESTQVDYLTGTLNRKVLDQKLDEFIEYSSDNTFGVVMLDIDDFKKVNDTYGHSFGDEVLVQVASTIKESLRSNDLVCRFGGEEFVLILSGSTREVSLKICNRILDNIRRDTTEKFAITITVSMGLISYSKEYSKEDLLKKADENLYVAKKEGKDKVVG
jgi:diguanylate cyclase (GGDEF)-like protein